MLLKENIIPIVEQILAESDKFVTSVRVLAGNRIIIHIDSDSTVTIADCADISRKIETILDRDKEDFEIEVSSHGLTQGLAFPRQFKKNIGKILDITMKDGSKLTGKLVFSDEEGFIIEINNGKKTSKKLPETSTMRIEYSGTKKTTIHITF